LGPIYTVKCLLPVYEANTQFFIYLQSSLAISFLNIILAVVLYGCVTWSLTLRKEHRLRLFENRVLRRIFGPNRIEVAWERRKLHSEELNDVYCSPIYFWFHKAGNFLNSFKQVSF